MHWITALHSKNKPRPTAQESAHIERIKLMACIVCDAPPPCDAHEPEQGLWFLSMPLCKDDHTGPHGWHGDKSRWRAAKMTELKAMNETHRRVEELRAGVTTFGTARRSATKPPKSSNYERSNKICPRKYA